MKMDGLYLAVLMNLGWFLLMCLLHLPRLQSPATYARRCAQKEVNNISGKMGQISSDRQNVYSKATCIFRPTALANFSSVERRMSVA
jgi:hypothetical protein